MLAHGSRCAAGEHSQWAPGMSASDWQSVDYMDPGWLPG